MTMEAFLEDVRTLAAERLSDPEMRRKVLAVPIYWGNSYDHNPLGAMLGYAGFGETIYYRDRENLTRRVKVVLYKDNFYTDGKYAPSPRMIAFVLIHELGHVATVLGHESELWAAVTREMGACEEVYSRKGPNGGGKFRLDPDMLAAVTKLTSWPQEEYPV